MGSATSLHAHWKLDVKYYVQPKVLALSKCDVTLWLITSTSSDLLQIFLVCKMYVRIRSNEPHCKQLLTHDYADLSGHVYMCMCCTTLTYIDMHAKHAAYDDIHAHTTARTVQREQR